MSKLCIFAGTNEGRHLVEALTGRGLRITACTATEYGEILLGEHPDVTVRAGRMDVNEMKAFLRENGFDCVVDTTHPYAAIVTENIVEACRCAGIDYIRLERETNGRAEDGVFVRNADECAAFLLKTQGNILLTTGSKELAPYRELADRIYARVLPLQKSIEACSDNGIAASHIIAMQGPFSEEMNCAMLRSVNASYMVTKDTGDAGGYRAKIRAAVAVGAVSVIIGKPSASNGKQPDEVLKQLESRFSLPPRPKKVYLVGIGMGDPDTRTLGMERAVRESDCLIGAKRMLTCVDTAGKQTHEAILSEDIANFIRNDNGNVYTVLFSGDTGFYSGAARLSGLLSDMDLRILPGIGSLQYFCSKLARPWQDVRAISLHGRDCNFLQEVRTHAAVFALLGKNGVKDALARLTSAGMGGLNVHIGEQLGYPSEKITSGTAEQLLNGRYDDLSVLLVENPAGSETVVTSGLPDEAFMRTEVPMTKSEVRAVSLSKLQLTQHSLVYDIGSGSGSVSVECALAARYGRVYAIERKAEAVELSKQNCRKFGLDNVEVISGLAPDAFEGLPAPTHAFIGGSAGNMTEIFDALLKRSPGVRIVANAVTLETVAELTELCNRFDEHEVVCMNIAKPRIVGRYHLMTGQNPVYIFTMQNKI